jgi:hypothetical protein
MPKSQVHLAIMEACQRIKLWSIATYNTSPKLSFLIPSMYSICPTHTILLHFVAR